MNRKQIFILILMMSDYDVMAGNADVYRSEIRSSKRYFLRMSGVELLPQIVWVYVGLVM